MLKLAAPANLGTKIIRMNKNRSGMLRRNAITKHVHVAENGHLGYIERDHAGTVKFCGTSEHALHLTSFIRSPA